jgi:hypothetical protein
VKTSSTLLDESVKGLAAAAVINQEGGQCVAMVSCKEENTVGTSLPLRVGRSNLEEYFTLICIQRLLQPNWRVEKEKGVETSPRP